MSAWPPWKPSGKLSAEAPRHLYHITWVINALSKLPRIPLGLSNPPVCSEVPSHCCSEFPVESLQFVWVSVCLCVSSLVYVCQRTTETLWLGGIVNLHLPMVTDWAPLWKHQPPSQRHRLLTVISKAHKHSHIHTNMHEQGQRHLGISCPFNLPLFLSPSHYIFVYITCHCFLTQQATQMRWVREGTRNSASRLRYCVSWIWTREIVRGSGR